MSPVPTWHYNSYYHIIDYVSYTDLHFCFFLKISLFLERGEGRDKKRMRNLDVGRIIHWLPLLCVLTEPETQACGLPFAGPHTTTEPHQLVPYTLVLIQENKIKLDFIQCGKYYTQLLAAQEHVSILDSIH